MGLLAVDMESETYALVVGRVVATLRKREGWSQSLLATKAGISQSKLSRIERGQVLPYLYVFRCLARAFGLAPEELQRKVDRAVV